MKKSVIFLINGLGIEKPGSYSIAIDQCMPNLSRTKETSYFTTAIINSLEYRSAYEQFFLGDSYRKELDYVRYNVVNERIVNNPTYRNLVNSLGEGKTKLHVFLEPNNSKIVEEINALVGMLPLAKDREVYLHLLMTQQSVNEYSKLVDIINYIKYHINTRITVGFIMGKELFSENLSKDMTFYIKKMLFACSCERWAETEKKLESLKNDKVRPCEAMGFCATNSCSICNGDTLLFFNTRRTSYDNFIKVIFENAQEAFKTDQISLPIYSLIHLDTQYNIPYFAENIGYDNSLANMLNKHNKNALIITEQKNLRLINFLANGLNYVNNPRIQYTALDNSYLSNKETIENIIDKSAFDLIIFDYHMDFSKTVNDLKMQLASIDVVLGLVAACCENKHSLFITSLYGAKKELPLADYNSEMVTINYEMQIPIFFFDYSYLRSKYALFPGETNNILTSAIRCITNDESLETLVRSKNILKNLLGAFK